MTGLSPAVMAVALLAGLTAPCLAQKPSPSPAPKKETPSYTGDDLDRLAGRTPGEAPDPKKTPTPPPPGTPQANEGEPPPGWEIKIERSREGNADEGPEPAQGSWSERAQGLRDQLAQAEEHVKDLDSQAQALLWQYLQSTDTYEILRLKAEQQDLLDQIPDAKKAAEDAQKAMSDFEKEAAQAGVPPSEIKEKKNP